MHKILAPIASSSAPAKIEQVVKLLNLAPLTLYSADAQVMRQVNASEVACALIDNLNLGGYLDDKILSEAVFTLALARPFAKDAAIVSRDLCQARACAMNGQEFSAAQFITELDKIDYLLQADLVHLLIYCSQTAFDRQYGQERNQLQTKPWLLIHRDRFLANCEALGLTLSRANLKLSAIDTVMVMGARYAFMVARWEFFKQQLSHAANVVFCVGNRELSVGFETEALIKAVADFHQITHQGEFEKRADARVYLKSEKPVTEAMMATHLLSQQKSGSNVQLLHSNASEGHWRTTTAANAEDMAKQLVARLKAEPIPSGTSINVVVVAEQPFSERMGMSVRSKIMQALQQAGLTTEQVNVISAGPILNCSELRQEVEDKQGLLLTVINSDQAAYVAEAYNSVVAQQPQLASRPNDAMMFMKRSQWRKTKEAEQSAKPDYTLSLAALVPLTANSPIFTPAAAASSTIVTAGSSPASPTQASSNTNTSLK